MTLIWCLSPLIGFFLTPIMGSLSDRCRSNLGRRRPFIIFLSIGVIIGKYFFLLPPFFSSFHMCSLESNFYVIMQISIEARNSLFNFQAVLPDPKILSLTLFFYFNHSEIKNFAHTRKTRKFLRVSKIFYF